MLESLPNAAVVARQNRAFMHRAVRHLAAEHGVRQFLDIGTGIPTSPNLHEVVQGVAPESRVVYTDNDPIVLVHSRALHISSPEGRTAYIPGDLCDPDAILGHPELSGTLDLSRPVALTLVAVLHWLPKDVDPFPIVRRIMDALPAGSHLALTHVTDDFAAAAVQQVSDGLKAKGSSHINGRSRQEVAAFFDGMELLEPGLTVVQRWRPEPAEAGTDTPGDTDIPLYAGVARKG